MSKFGHVLMPILYTCDQNTVDWKSLTNTCAQNSLRRQVSPQSTDLHTPFVLHNDEVEKSHFGSRSCLKFDFEGYLCRFSTAWSSLFSAKRSYESELLGVSITPIFAHTLGFSGPRWSISDTTRVEWLKNLRICFSVHRYADGLGTKAIPLNYRVI